MKTYFSDFTNASYGPSAFIRLLERRVQKDWREHQLFAQGKRYALYVDGTLTAALFLKLIEQRPRLRAQIELLKPNQPIPSSHILLYPDCLETYASKRLLVFLKAATPLAFSQPSPLRSLTAQECEQLAALWHITGKQIPPSHPLLESLQHTYVQTKPSMLKSFQSLDALALFSENKQMHS
jgi:hypothetical protein